MGQLGKLSGLGPDDLGSNPSNPIFIMERDKFVNNLREKIDLLENEKDKAKMKDLMVDIIVDLEKFCHRDDVQIHHVLVDARERSKREIKNLINNI